MSTANSPGGSFASAGTDWRRAEFVLALIAFLTFALIPIKLKTIYSGLPAHPFFLHVPVMVLPVAVLGAIAFVARPQWWGRYGIALCVLAIIGMGGVFLTMGAGSALRDALQLQQNSLVQRHSQAADKLRLLDIVFTAVVIVSFAAERISGGLPTRHALLDRLLAPRLTVVALRVVLVLLALGTAYLTWKVGDLGAKAVWQGRLSHSGFPGPGGPPGVGGLSTPQGG